MRSTASLAVLPLAALGIGACSDSAPEITRADREELLTFCTDAARYTDEACRDIIGETLGYVEGTDCTAVDVRRAFRDHLEQDEKNYQEWADADAETIEGDVPGRGVGR